MWAALLGGLISIAGSLVGRVFVALGISVATYSGLTVTIGWLKDQMVASFAGLPADLVGMLALLQVGSCISMVLSAIAVKLTLDGLKDGILTKWTK